MKITHLSSKYQKYYSFKSKPENINNLTGIDVLDKYKNIFETNDVYSDKQDSGINTILYNVIFQLFDNGYYKNAKIFYDELRKRVDITNDIDINKTMGDIHKRQGDIESAGIQYKTVYDNMGIDYHRLSLDGLEAIKNSAEADIILQKDINSYKIDELGENDVSYLNLYSLYLRAKRNILQDKKQEAFNDIGMAYSLMESKKLHDDDVILGKALALSEKGDYIKSSMILNKNLKYLEDNKKVYSREFVENLLLLGINDYETKAVDDRKIINLFKNSVNIAEEIDIPELVEMANYMVAKILFANNDEIFVEFAEGLLDRTDNVVYKSNLSEMLGDYYISNNKDKDRGIELYNLSKSLLMGNNLSKVKIIELCEKIKKNSPEQTEALNKEIEALKTPNLYNQTFLVSILNKYYKTKDFDLLKETCEQVLSGNSNETNKKIARVYMNFVNINNGYDLNKLISENKVILSSLDKEAKEIKDNVLLNKFLFIANTYTADILYTAQRYYEAANYKNEADNYIHVYTNKSDILRHKVETTLMNYKAKNYYKAEKTGLEYLEMLLGIELPPRPTDITETVEDVINDKNDAEKRKIASVYETLGLINLKNKNIKDAECYFSDAVNIRERLFDRDLQLANSYSALARLAIINKNLFKGGVSSKDMHSKALEILNNKYPNEQITKEENAFHKKYYGIGKISAGKYAKSLLGYNDKLIEKFKCYNKELSICE